MTSNIFDVIQSRLADLRNRGMKPIAIFVGRRLRAEIFNHSLARRYVELRPRPSLFGHPLYSVDEDADYLLVASEPEEPLR